MQIKCIDLHYLGFPLDNFKLVLNASIFFQHSKIFPSSWAKSIDSGTGSIITVNKGVQKNVNITFRKKKHVMD